ncbi:DoxX family protein [Bacteriovoracales bacterium]|nr:DoxX family protein [Bacteriovoracales bacterium]
MLKVAIILEVLKVLTLASVVFVWFIRYENIVHEFKKYGYSDKLRDFVGILKLSSVILIQSSNPLVFKFGSATLGFLMLAAVITHIKTKNPLIEMIPSFTLMVFSILFIVLS